MPDKSDSNSNARIALFIDIENLLSGASTIGLPLDVSPILKELKGYGNVQIRKCFGDILKCLQSVGKGREINNVRKMLYSNLVNIEDVPYTTIHKNTADIRLVIDALSTAYQYEDITHFAIVASDRDYVPLFNKLHELGRTVIAVGIDRQNTNPIVIDASDFMFYYEALFAAPAVEKESEEDEEDVQTLMESYFDVLGQSIRTLEMRGQAATSAAVSKVMREIRSDFSPELVNLSGFKEFIDKAIEANIAVIDEPQGAGDPILSKPSETDKPTSTIPAVQPVYGDSTLTLIDRYKEFLEAGLRIPLPDLVSLPPFLDH